MRATACVCCVTSFQTCGSSYCCFVRVNVNDNCSVFVKFKTGFKVFSYIVCECTTTNNKSCFSVFIGFIYMNKTFNCTTCDITCTTYNTFVAGKIIIPVVNINCCIRISCACIYDCSTFKIKNTVNTNCNLLFCADSSLALNCKSLVDTNVYKRIACIVIVSSRGSNAMTVKIKCEFTSNFSVICCLNIEIFRSFNVSKKNDYITVNCRIKCFLNCFKLNVANLGNCYKSINVRVNVRITTRTCVGCITLSFKCGCSNY